MASIGEVIGGKYRLDRLLGEGGMGAVFAAENLNTGRRVAVKLLHGAWMQRPEVAQRFVREARATTAIAHPNIVEVLDLDNDVARGITYIVQEFLEGETLEAHLATRPGRRLVPTEALAILVPVMGALVAAHARGIVHRDLKPANLFLSRTRNGEVVPKVIDFGIAKDVAAPQSASNRTQEGSAIGTPAYMSPEQVAGQTDVDAQTDVWSLGVVLYEMLSGRLPFESPNTNVLMAKILLEAPTPLAVHFPDCPAELAEVVARALRRERSERLGSMRLMMSAALECECGPKAPASLPPAYPQQVTPHSPAPTQQATQPVQGMGTPQAFAHATQPVQGMAAPQSTQPWQSPASNPWSPIAPYVRGEASPSLPPPAMAASPDTIHAISRTVTQPGLEARRLSSRVVALTGVTAVLVLGAVGSLLASGSTPAAPVAAPVTVIRPAAVSDRTAPAPPSPRPLPTLAPPAAPAVLVRPPQAVAPPAVRVSPPAPEAAPGSVVQPAGVVVPVTRSAPPAHPATLSRGSRSHSGRSGRPLPRGALIPMPGFETQRPAPAGAPHLNADEM